MGHDKQVCVSEEGSTVVLLVLETGTNFMQDRSFLYANEYQ
jgi:hypothetical protein